MEMLFRSATAALPARRSPGHVRRLRALVTTLATLVALPLATGCAANFSAQTQKQYQPAVGSNNRDTAIYLLNVLVVADDSGDGTLVGTLLNSDPRGTGCPDYLIDLQAVDNTGGGVETSRLPAAEDVTVPDGCDDTTPDDGISLAAQQPARLPEDATVQLHADSVSPGTFITVTLRFQSSQPIELDVPVVTQSDVYSDVTVGPVETPNEASTPAN